MRKQKAIIKNLILLKKRLLALMYKKILKKAGAELGQAQLKLEFGFDFNFL